MKPLKSPRDPNELLQWLASKPMPLFHSPQTEWIVGRLHRLRPVLLLARELYQVQLREGIGRREWRSFVQQCIGSSSGIIGGRATRTCRPRSPVQSGFGNALSSWRKSTFNEADKTQGGSEWRRRFAVSSLCFLFNGLLYRFKRGSRCFFQTGPVLISIVLERAFLFWAVSYPSWAWVLYSS